MAGTAMYGLNSKSGPSPGLWGLAPRDIFYDPAVAFGYYEDFIEWMPLTAGAESDHIKGWQEFGSTGATGVLEVDEQGGMFSLASDGDDEGASISSEVLPFRISKTLPDLYFECRLKSSTIANTKHGIVVGLMDGTAISATVPIAADGTLADANFVGFHRLEGDGDTFDTVYKANTVAVVTVKADATTIVADTYVKLGFRAHRGTLTYFVNGVPLTDTKAIPDATGTDFPADVNLGPVAAVLNATATTPGDTTIDWIICKQLRA